MLLWESTRVYVADVVTARPTSILVECWEEVVAVNAIWELNACPFTIYLACLCLIATEITRLLLSI